MKKVNIITLFLIVSFLLFTLSSSAQNPEDEWLVEAAKPYKGVTLHMIGEALPPLDALKQKSVEFTELTGIKVEFEMFAMDEADEKAIADYVAGTGIYDITMTSNSTVSRDAENGWLEPVETFIDNKKITSPNFYIGMDISNLEWLNGNFEYKGKLYGLPFSFHTLIYDWRVDLFEHPEEREKFKAKYGYELPVPAINMDQLRDLSEFFTRKKGEKIGDEILDHDVYGITLCGKRHIATVFNFKNVLSAFNGKIIDAPTGFDYGPVVINSEEAIRALIYYKDLYDNFCPPGSDTYTWDEQLAAMQSGLAVQTLLWADACYAISEDPSQSRVVGKVAYSGMPIAARKTTNLNGWALCIPSASKNKEAAWLFLQWTQRKEVQAEIMANGSISLSDSAYQDPKVYKLTYAPSHYFITHARILELDGKKAFREPGSAWGLPKEYAETPDPLTGELFPAAFDQPRFPEAVVIDDILARYINGCLVGQYVPEVALDKAAEEIKNKIPKLKDF
jgi:multiple sugar transport system substrate-binding protein